MTEQRKRKYVHAYRNLVLKFHADRGGDDEQFKKIKRGIRRSDRLGKKYPDTTGGKKKKSKILFR